MFSTEKNFFHFQEGAKRLNAAMTGIPDRIPVLAQLHEFAMKELGIGAQKFYTTPETLVVATFETQKKYGIDVPMLDYDVYNIEAEALGQKIKYSDTDMPDVDRTQPLIREPADLKKIRTPDFDMDGRFSQVIQMNRIFEKLTGISDNTLQICAPFSLAANLMRLEDLILNMYENPDFICQLFDRIVENVLAPWVLRLKQEFPDAKSISAADATASLPIISPDITRKWIIPYIIRLREITGSEVYVPNWVGEKYLKNPKEMLDLKHQVCSEFVEGQDPDIEKLGPAMYKEYANKMGLPLILGIGAAFLALSTPDEVSKRVRHYIKIGGKDGHFALLLCNLGATTPPDNVHAVIQTVDRYGIYS